MADALLFPVLGSSMDVVTVAVLVGVAMASALTVIVALTVAPLLTVPMLQVTSWPMAVHSAEETKLTAAGRVSVMVTFSAKSGPLLVTVRV